MTSDLRALLAAIAADPADDTLRLAYADCLEESGNAPRAEFIRLQVEAERLHPHSNARGALEDRARTLFEQNWRGWWEEVCEAVGMDPTGYQLVGTALRGMRTEPEVPAREEDAEDPLDLDQVAFRRGFPESVMFSALASSRKPVRESLLRWNRVSPLVEIASSGWRPDQPSWWPRGSYLQTVRAAAFQSYGPDGLSRVLRTPDLANVERLTLLPCYNRDSRLDEVKAVLKASCVRQLRHVRLPVVNAETVAALSAAGTFPTLDSLCADVRYGSDDNELTRRLTNLAAVPWAPQLSSLEIRGHIGERELEVICRHPAWARLRRLGLVRLYQPNTFKAFAADRYLSRSRRTPSRRR